MNANLNILSMDGATQAALRPLARAWDPDETIRTGLGVNALPGAPKTLPSPSVVRDYVRLTGAWDGRPTRRL